MIPALAAGVIGLSLLAGPVTVRGRVVRVQHGDTVVAAGARVVLHAVTPERQGPLDSVIADAQGRFRITATADSGAVLLLSARWQGVEYFAPPFGDAAEPITLVAVDTSSQQSVAVAARHVIVGGPAADGTRDVVDLIVIANRGERTRTAPDSLHPSWTMALPPHVANLTVGDADFSPEAFDLHGDTLMLSAPIPPGERQFFLMYQVPPGARRLQLPLGAALDTLSLLSEEHEVTTAPALTVTGEETVSGRVFQRQVGGRALGDTLVVTLPGAARVPSWLLPLLVALFGATLLLVSWRSLVGARPTR